MMDFTELMRQGASHAWLFIPSAVVLGALHGLEPGHSKTMMAAFIIAIRGTVKQAIMLGLCATFSHTLIVWVIALGGMYLWRGLAPETIEPYLQLASAVIIIGMALWMLYRVRKDQSLAALAGGHDHGHDHDHDHGHSHDHHGHDHGHAPQPAAAGMIVTRSGAMRLTIAEEAGEARFRLVTERGHGWDAPGVRVETESPGGARQAFAFLDRGGYLESVEPIAGEQDFMASVILAHDGHAHTYDVPFLKSAAGHDHMHEELRGLELTSPGYQDAHELAHANDIRRRFAGREVTNGQIILFGLTGGLIPCPGAITVLILCLQLKAFVLGAVLVLCFSIGLAMTMVASGVLAAISVKHVSKRFTGFGEIVRKAPYVSAVVILLIGLYLGVNGWLHLPQAA